MNAVDLSDVIVNVRSLLLIFGNASDTRAYFEQIKNVSPFPIFVWPLDTRSECTHKCN